MKLFRWLITAVGLLLLSGCFQVAEVLHVNPDGSGTVEETVLISKKFLAQMKALMTGMMDAPADTAGTGPAATPPVPAAPPAPLDLYDPDLLRKQAGDMGEGVTFRSVRKVETADFSGFTAVYAFADINQLNLNQQGAGLKVPGAGAGPSMPMAGFKFTKGAPGSPAKLAIAQPAATAPQAAPSVPEPPALSPDAPMAAPDEEARKVMEMFKGMKFLLAIDINGSIISTNAAFRDGNRITVLDCDLDKLGSALADPQLRNKLQSPSLMDARAALKGMPGMKVDTNDTLTVVFDKR
ncbi:hypothetical protein [Geomesophilobacter sediminis]|uniref:Lipoprotein n=1 Tax=Geomesophilobacter sediminis TaxID=2798584 RepID=A0A8J7IR34_9BACT|nr:hypothetical protein [Geomesophilobacter sediminis]MBJ6725254.1 hypothetical protein [Geomesophilobacter sediminis]